MVRGISNISISAIISNASQGGKMSLPVDPSRLIYSNFEHVSGIAAPEGSQGITISRLKIIDVLIGQINQIRRDAINNQSNRFNQLNQLPLDSPENMDALIQNLENQIRQAKTASEAMPYIPSPSAPSGVVFNLTV